MGREEGHIWLDCLAVGLNFTGRTRVKNTGEKWNSNNESIKKNNRKRDRTENLKGRGEKNQVRLVGESETERRKETKKKASITPTQSAAEPVTVTVQPSCLPSTTLKPHPQFQSGTEGHLEAITHEVTAQKCRLQGRREGWRGEKESKGFPGSDMRRENVKRDGQRGGRGLWMAFSHF